MKSAAIIGFIILSFFVVQAQEDEKNDEIALLVGYSGEFIFHPGLQVGIIGPVREITKFKERKGSESTRALLLSGDVLMYIHPNSHIGLLTEIGCKLRFTGHRKVFREIGFDAGYFHQFNASTTYEMNSEGDIEKVPHAGNAYFMPSTSFTIGNVVKKNPSIGWYTGLKVGVQMPYNTAAVPKVFVHTGLLYKLRKRS